MVKKRKEIEAVLKNADGTICENLSKKEWSPELRQRVSVTMGDIMLAKLEKSVKGGTP